RSCASRQSRELAEDDRLGSSGLKIGIEESSVADFVERVAGDILRAIGIEIRQGDLIVVQRLVGSTSMGGLLPIPPSSAYCVHRSASISSAAARNWRMATSPAPREPPPCARAKVAFVNKPAPTTAAPPARRLPFIKERRSTERLVGRTSSLSFIVSSIFLLVIWFMRYGYCGLDAAAERRDAQRMSFNRHKDVI